MSPKKKPPSVVLNAHGPCPFGKRVPSRRLITEFYQLPEPLLRKALDVLIRQGKAQVLKGLGEDGDGVKFV